MALAVERPPSGQRTVDEFIVAGGVERQDLDERLAQPLAKVGGPAVADGDDRNTVVGAERRLELAQRAAGVFKLGDCRRLALAVLGRHLADDDLGTAMSTPPRREASSRASAAGPVRCQSFSMITLESSTTYTPKG